MASLRAKIEAAYKRRDKASDAVFAAAHPRRDVVFSECLKLATPEVVQAYRDADSAHYALELDAISAGKAWRSGSLLMWRH